MFKKRYILKIYDDKEGPALIVGKAAHKALEMIYKGMSVEEATLVGLEHINKIPDSLIDYGKTGSREQIMKNYHQGLQFYLTEVPTYKEILGVEKGIVAEAKDREGNPLPLPLKSYPDLIVRNENGGLDLIDHKFVSTYSDAAIDDPTHILQAMFNFHTVEAEFGEAPQRMIFNECKISQNKDGSPQLQPYVVEFEGHPDYFSFFYKLVRDCTRELMKPDVQFLPNFRDMFDGDNAFEVYRADLIDVEAPVAVNHKTMHKEYVEKKFIASELNKVENAEFTNEERIRSKLLEFGLPVEMQQTHAGASVIQYTLKPSRGIRMTEIEKHEKDLALALKASSIRIQAPIMGTDLVGVEIPNPDRTIVPFEIAELTKGTLNIPIGVDVYGNSVVKDLTKMPHLLIAGATGSGKSVMMNVIIQALTTQNNPDTLQMILVDPKRVEFGIYKDLPHLMGKIITEVNQASITLSWLIDEMEYRYGLLEEMGARNIQIYNENVAQTLPFIVVMIDEFADLILSAPTPVTVPKEVLNKKAKKMLEEGAKTDELREMYKSEVPMASIESMIVRLAQKARAVGIHLIIGTQRPSVDVVTGLIKANLPTRIAFMTASGIDSKVILDQAGAEELLGNGDMLFLDPNTRGLQRLQGYYLD